MAPAQDRHPQFHIPFEDAEKSTETKDHAEWDKASTVKPEGSPQQEQAEQVGRPLTEEKTDGRESSPDPETFDKIEITEEDCFDELGFCE